MTASTDATHGIVLSGGGGYAAYEIGVMRALCSGVSQATGRARVEPAIVSGTSGGAFNAALFCTAGGPALDALDYVEDVWLELVAGTPGCGNDVVRIRGNPFSLLNPACPRQRAVEELADDLRSLSGEFVDRVNLFAEARASLLQRSLEVFDASIVVAADRFARVVEETVDPARIRQSPTQLRIAATNWLTGELRVYANSEMTDERAHRVVMASAAIPGIFQSVEVDGQPFVDGGVVMNTPLSPVIDAGADIVHAVYMDPTAANVPLARVRSTASTLYRFLVISLAATMNRDIEVATRINRGITAVASGDDGGGIEEIKGRYMLAGAWPRATFYRELTIHRFHPSEDLGGALRWLEFDRDRMIRLMERGYEDARTHDCDEQSCVVVNA